MIRNRKDIVLIAVDNNGLSLEFASTKLKNNKKIALTAFNQNPGAILHIGKFLRNKNIPY